MIHTVYTEAEWLAVMSWMLHNGHDTYHNGRKRKPLAKFSNRRKREARVIPLVVLAHQIACGDLYVNDRESLAHVVEIIVSNLLDKKAKVSLDTSNAAAITNVLATQLAKGDMSSKQVQSLLATARDEPLMSNVPTTNSVLARKEPRAGWGLNTINTSRDRVDGTCVPLDLTIIPMWLHSRGWSSVFRHEHNPCMVHVQNKLFVFGLPFKSKQKRNAT